jgi:signal transduction histidine kinase
VFDLFFRAAKGRSAPGAGIGLFVCRQLVEAMGGTMALAEGDGGGACLRVWLPLYETT